MYFKRIELNGFKSFADPVTIEFSDGITCIVGPNGSGKSNISDAIRWVLGEQSPKSLRGGKMEDVIFAGTQNRKAKGMAEVTLVIDNSERLLPIDFAEVGITRRMYGDGKSEYMINRAPCRLRDIRELIMDTGIGVEGYSVIGQGKISDIVSDKMESRREIFEEAAGIVKYRVKKDEAGRDLNAASANLDRVNDIIREIEGRIDGLRSDSEKASEYLEIREKYKHAEINILLNNIESAQMREQAASEETKTLALQLEELTKQRDDADGELAALRTELEAAEGRLDNLRSELISKNDEINGIANADQLNRQKLQSLQDSSRRIDADIELIAQRIEEANNALGSILKEKAEEEKQESSVKKLLEEKQKLLADAKSACDALQKRIDEKKNDLFELNSEISALRSDISSCEGIKNTLSKRREMLESNQDERAELISAQEKELEQSEKDLIQIEEAEERLKKSFDDENRKAADASVRIDELKSLLNRKRLLTGQLAERCRVLNDLESSYEGYNGGVRFIMKQKLGGISGVLGEMIEVPKGWELAIETELGTKMQNIVCKTDDDAKKAIEILKKNQAGRLTFLPESSVRPGKPGDVESVENCKGFLGLASEEVSISNGCQNIIDYLLGRVVICDNIDNAVLMSKKKDTGLRFVTLQGEIVSAQGAITGGSIKNNSASILSRKAEKEAAKAEIEAITAEIEKTEKDIAKAEADRDEAKTKRDITANAINDKKTDKALLTQKIEQLNASLIEVRQNDERRAAEIRETVTEIEKAEAGIKADEQHISEKQEKIEGLTEEIEHLTNDMSSLKEKENAAADEESKARIDDSSFSIRMSGILQRENDARTRIRELEDDRLQRKKELDSNRIEEKQIDDFKDGASDLLRIKESEKSDISDQIEALTKQKSELSEKAAKAEEERKRADSRIFEKSGEKHDADMRYAKYSSQSESAKEKLFEEFEISYAQAVEMQDPEFVMSKGQKEAKEYRDRMREIGDVNIGAIEEYKSVKERYESMSSQQQDLTAAISDLKSIISDTDKTIKERFTESFNDVVINFEKSFSEIFKGGHARLSLENPADPMNSAIEIEAQPPGKKLQNINLLSGGEKTMTAIALMFAVLRSKPTPFCILDEVEAALDENNIGVFARYLDNFENTQFALITHQKATMQYADIMYGITMAEHGISKVLALKLDSGESK